MPLPLHGTMAADGYQDAQTVHQLLEEMADIIGMPATTGEEAVPQMTYGMPNPSYQGLNQLPLLQASISCGSLPVCLYVKL